MIRTWAVLGFAACLSQAPQPQHQSAKPQKYPAADQRGSPQAPVVVKIVPAEKTQDETRADTKEKTDHATNEAWLTKSTVALAVFTFFLMVGTAVLARYTYRLWSATTDMAKDASDSANRQAELTREAITHADRSAKAAIDSVAVARESVGAQVEQAARAAKIMEAQVAQATAATRRDLRAYVGVNAGRLSHFPTTGDTLAVEVEVKNFGHTPAYNMRIQVAASYTSNVHPVDDPGPALTESHDAGFVLDPTQMRIVRSNGREPLAANEATVLRDGRDPEHGEVRWCIRGRIDYTDVFDGKHVRHFCHMYGGKSGVMPDYCKVHNTSD